MADAEIRLQAQGLVRYSRGVITIIGRCGLELLACDCYWIVRAEFNHTVRGE